MLPKAWMHVLMLRTVQSSSSGYSTDDTTANAKLMELMGPGEYPELLFS